MKCFVEYFVQACYVKVARGFSSSVSLPKGYFFPVDVSFVLVVHICTGGAERALHGAEKGRY